MDIFGLFQLGKYVYKTVEFILNKLIQILAAWKCTDTYGQTDTQARADTHTHTHDTEQSEQGASSQHLTTVAYVNMHTVWTNIDGI